MSFPVKNVQLVPRRSILQQVARPFPVQNAMSPLALDFTKLKKEKSFSLFVPVVASVWGKAHSFERGLARQALQQRGCSNFFRGVKYPLN